jgi:hypothetical protein
MTALKLLCKSTLRFHRGRRVLSGWSSRLSFVSFFVVQPQFRQRHGAGEDDRAAGRARAGVDERPSVRPRMKHRTLTWSSPILRGNRQHINSR